MPTFSGSLSQRPRLLLIGHTYAAVENRKKIQALAAHFDLTCVSSTLETTVILGRPASDFDNDTDEPARKYKLVRCRRVGRSITTFYYEGLSDVMRSGTFDVVLVENEPWAVICWQARLLKGRFQPDALFGIFTWENVVRPSWKGWILERVYRCMTATTDFIIAGNQRAKELVVEYGARDESVLVAAQLGVDLENHQPAIGAELAELRASQGLPQEAVLVGYCGRLTEEKGLKELVVACEAVNSKKTDPIHLVILGAGVLKPWFEEQSARYPWIHLLPPRPHFEIPTFMRSLDIFVLASKPLRIPGTVWDEQFGHVLIEAMACGVVTVGSSSGAIPEVLDDPSVTFPWGDAEALTVMLQRLTNSPSERQAVVTRQLDRVRTHYTQEAVAARWADFILQKLAS